MTDKNKKRSGERVAPLDVRKMKLFLTRWYKAVP